MKRFFLFCAGANRAILNECPTDETKYAGIGATILLTALLGVLSGGYALFTVFKSVLAGAAFGAFWGVVIFNLDRVIVSGMRKQSHFLLDLLYAGPRFLVAILLAIVISRPLELKLFEREIRAEIARMNDEGYTAAVQRVDRAFGRLDELKSENERLRLQIEDKRREHDARYAEWLAERDGTGGSGIPGRGSRFDEKGQRLESARQEMEEVKNQNYPLIQRNQQEIDRLEADRQRQIATTDAAQRQADGFLARMEAYGRLERSSDAIRLAGLFITLLFVALETAPVMVKLLATLSPYRPYDELLEQREFEVVEVSRQKRKIRLHELEVAREKAISDYNDVVNTEIRLSTEKNKLRLQAELTANEALIDQIAEAQAALAARIVEEWKRQEMDKIEQNLGTYVP